jgi:capsular exopolysaccharide synthesis family protein
MRERRELMVSVPETAEIAKPIEIKQMPYQGPYRMDTAEDKVHLLDYWRSIRKRLWLVIGITVLLTSLVAIYQSRKPDIYEAHSQVLVDPERIDPSLADKNSPVTLFGSNDQTYLGTQLQILTSDSLLRKVIKKLDLENNKDFLVTKAQKNNSLWESFKRTIGLGEKEKTKNTDEVPVDASTSSSGNEDLGEAQRLAPYVKALKKTLTVEPVRESRLQIKETRLIYISYQNTDPVIAAKVVNTLAETYALQNDERKKASTTTTSDYLKKRIEELNVDVKKDSDALVAYAKDKNIINLSGEDNIVLNRLATLNTALIKAENERKQAEAEFNAANIDDGAKALVIDETLRRYLDETDLRIAQLEQKKAELLVENTEAWPPVIETNNAIKILQEQKANALKQVGANRLVVLKTKLNQMKEIEKKLKEAFETQKKVAIIQNQNGINYGIIKQRLETNQSLLKDLQEKQRQNLIQQAGTPNNISVADYSIVPEEPIGPRRLMSVMVAFVLSLGLGCGLALFLEYLDDTVRSTDDVENLLRLPALAVIPAIENTQRKKLLLAGSNQSNSSTALQQSELLLKADSRSSLAEAYRQLRTSILLSSAGHAPKTLLITSSVPSEGKTTTAVNTATTLAQTGASVLVVDADMRRPRLHTIFQKDNREGLSTILSSEMTEGEIFSVIKRHENTSLHLLTSGPIPPNPAELIGSEQMRRLIKMLERNFTHVVIDSPPIASFTDGVLVSSLVDGVLLVVHAGKSSRGIVRRSRQLLHDVGAKIFGVVLNNVNVKSQDGYYYYQSYYHQSYYHRDDEDDAADDN